MTRAVALAKPAMRRREVVLKVVERMVTGTSAAAAPSLRTVTATSQPVLWPWPAGSSRGVTSVMVRSGRPRSWRTQSLKNQRRSMGLAAFFLPDF